MLPIRNGPKLEFKITRDAGTFLLINARMMGVTVGFIKELEAMGYERTPLRKLADMRMQGVHRR